jgi:hypothetical protein
LDVDAKPTFLVIFRNCQQNLYSYVFIFFYW